MPQGQSKYHLIAEQALNSTEADAVILFVFGGKEGHGAAMVGAAEYMPSLPHLLRSMADDMEAESAKKT